VSFHTAYQDDVEHLYHWQRLNPEYLTTLLRDQVIYCQAPEKFNDPWDCKPNFNTEILVDPVEHERHVEWAVHICRKHNRTMPEADIANMAVTLRTDRQLLASTIDQLPRRSWPVISARYRVYCLGPNIGNLLMWAHYAENHTGICLEFTTRDVVMCSALRVRYHESFPIVRAYSAEPEEALAPLLDKAAVWAYEREYRLIAQERSNATGHATLITDNNFLKLPETALLSVIVGCQGPYEEVRRLVARFAPHVIMKKAERVPNRFELRIGTPE
jgi:Protein of unknown function (DUF2971)